MATDLLPSPNDLKPWRLAFDTAALVLIWLVQLVIYPVFERMEATAFTDWHLVYTRRVTYVVMPIMLGQAALYAYLGWQAPGWSTWSGGALVLAMWAITFLTAVPLHAELGSTDKHLLLVPRLVAANWLRTAGWTAVWAITVATILFGGR